jgi:APA family basic amino acid/polyamine antiporter
MEQQTKQEGLTRTLGLKDATMMVAGSMIGSGIFIVSADMSRNLGGTGWLLLLWLISGVITVMAALSYGELAGMMPKAGGQFVYIQRAWGNLTGFLYGWSVFTVIQSGVIAAVAVGFAKFSGVFMPWINVDNVLFTLGFIKITSANLVAIALIVFLTWVNSRGVKEGKTIQMVFTSAKLLALLFLIVSGIYVGLNKDYFAQNFSNMWESSQWLQNADQTWSLQSISGMGLILALGTAIIGSLFSSDAWNNVTFIAGEIKDPHRNIPKSLLYGTAIVTVIYMLANIAYLGLLPVQGDPNGAGILEQGIQFATNDRVGTAAASQIFGEGALFLMAALIMVSTFGCNNGLILSGARVYYAMAKEGLFFKKAGTLNKNNVPQFALWIQAAWASILCLSGTYGDLLDYCTFASLLFYIVTIGGLFMLRKKEPDTARPYKVIAYPIMPILYILIATTICAILLVTKTQNTVSGLVIVALGLPIYYFIKPKAEGK